MILNRQPRAYENAIKYACAVYGVQVLFYTDEKNEDLMKVELVGVEPDEEGILLTWLISAEVQIKLRDDMARAREDRQDDLFNSLKVKF